MKKVWLDNVHWSVAYLMNVFRGLRVTHLDQLILGRDCKLRDSPLPDKHLCHLNTLTWWASVDILVMRTLLDCFPSDSIKLEDCKILLERGGAEKITINNPSTEMVINYILQCYLCLFFHSNIYTIIHIMLDVSWIRGFAKVIFTNSISVFTQNS